jgi:hypothetical protein
MKKLFITKSALAIAIAIAISSTVVNADTPQLINYQGHVSDSSGQPLDTSVSITFAIYDVATGGSPLWSEMHSAVIVDGFYSVNLGTFVVFPDDLFDAGSRYLGITIGGDAEISPRNQLVSVPYGLVTKRVSGDIETSEGTLTVLNPVTSDTAVSIDSSGIDLHSSALESEGTAKAAMGKIKVQGGSLTSQKGFGLIKVEETGIEFKYESSPGPELKLDIGSVVTFDVVDTAASLTKNGLKLFTGNVTAVDPASPGDTTVKLTGGASPSLVIGSAGGGQTNTVTPLTSWIKDNSTGKSIRKDLTIDPNMVFTHSGDSGEIHYNAGDFIFKSSAPAAKFKLELGEIKLSGLTDISGGTLKTEVVEVKMGNDFRIKKAADSNAVKMNWEDIQLTVPMYTDKQIILKQGSDSARIHFSDAVGSPRSYEIQPGKVDFPNLKFTISKEFSDEWLRWYGDHFVIGPSAEVVCSSDVKLRSLLQADVNADGLNDFVVSGVSPTVYVDGGTTFDCAGSAVFSSPVQVGAGAPPPPTSKLHVNGDFTATGAKLFVQNHPTDPEKEIVYVALEGGEAGTYVRGSAKLENGAAEITLPEDFYLVTNENGVTVQVTPTESVRGMLFVAEKSNKKVVVKSSNPADKAVSFDYVVNGVRKGFENHKPIRKKQVLVSRL